ncbi:MAG: ABC transporter ATP-binding protein [Chitinispirillaceae bacterium]
MPTNESSLELSYKNSSPLRTLLAVYSYDKWKVLCSLVFGAIKHTPFLFMPMIIGDLVTAVSDPAGHGADIIWRDMIVIVILLAQNIPLHTLFIKYASIAIRNMEIRLRTALVRRLQELSISFHENFQSGRLQSKVLRDVEAIEVLSRQSFMTVYHSFMTIVFATAVTVAKDRTVALFFLVTIPISALLVHMFRRKISSQSQDFRMETEAMSAMLGEMVAMLPVTRAHGVEKKEISKISSQMERVRSRGIRLDVTGAKFGASTWVSFQSFQVICLLFTGFMAYKGRIEVGDIVMYQTFFVQIVNSIGAIINIYPQLMKGFDSVKSIGEILECPDLEQNEGKKALSSVKGDLTYDNVTYYYEGSSKPAVCDFNLCIQNGECLALMGESGSGKTTLLNLTIGFRRPTSGRILIDGQDMQHLDLRTYRRYISVVPQETVLFSGTIEENITYGEDYTPRSKLLDVLDQSNVSQFINSLPEGLDTMIGEHGAKLSGGQRQRIAIARALIRDPRIIILDEATSALDAASEALVQEAINRLARGRTTIIVAHRLSTIRKADRIVVLKEGQCIESGTHKELLTMGGEFHKFHKLQA